MRGVGVLGTALGGVLALSGVARAEGAAGGATLTLGGGASASGSTSEAPAAEASASAEAAPPQADSGSGEREDDSWRSKNPAQYEFAFVSVGASQSWSIAGKVLFFGIGGGLGPPLYRVAKLSHGSTCGAAGTACYKSEFGWDHDLEIAYADVFLRIAPIKYVDINLGPKIALGSALFGVPDAPQSSFSYGGFVDLRFGSPKIKVGPRFEYDRVAHADFYEHGWRLTPLMVSVVH